LPGRLRRVSPSRTEGMIEARAHLIIENIARPARGEPPLNAIDPAG
jgi:hypothetical protein